MLKKQKGNINMMVGKFQEKMIRDECKRVSNNMAVMIYKSDLIDLCKEYEVKRTNGISKGQLYDLLCSTEHKGAVLDVLLEKMAISEYQLKDCFGVEWATIRELKSLQEVEFFKVNDYHSKFFSLHYFSDEFIDTLKSEIEEKKSYTVKIRVNAKTEKEVLETVSLLENTMDVFANNFEKFKDGSYVGYLLCRPNSELVNKHGTGSMFGKE